MASFRTKADRMAAQLADPPEPDDLEDALEADAGVLEEARALSKEIARYDKAIGGLYAAWLRRRNELEDLVMEALD